MMSKTLMLIPVILSSLMISSGCVLQPKAQTVKSWNIIEVETAPALRVEKPIRASFVDWLLRRDIPVSMAAKNSSGEWESIGKGTVPVGAYFKGRKPISESAK